MTTVGGRKRRARNINRMEKEHLHLRRLVLSNELHKSKYGRSVSGAERPTIIPSIGIVLFVSPCPPERRSALMVLSYLYR